MGAHWHWFKNKSGTTKTRPAWAGPVLVETESVGFHSRPVCVRGIVVTGSTAGRLSPPEPSNGMKVSFSLASTTLPTAYQLNTQTGENWHNDGSPVNDKGHIMAIELGGPDVAENIVPQLSNCQEHGAWRKMERDIKAIADKAKKSECYFFVAVLAYPRPLLETFSVPHRVLTPSTFRVSIHKLDLSNLPSTMDETAVAKLDLSNAPGQLMWDGPLDFSERDDLESARLAMDVMIKQQVSQGKTEAEAESSVSGFFPDVSSKFQTTKKTKKRTNKSAFNSKYVAPPVFKPRHPTTPSQNTQLLQGAVKGLLQDQLDERQIRKILKEMESRGAIKKSGNSMED